MNRKSATTPGKRENLKTGKGTTKFHIVLNKIEKTVETYFVDLKKGINISEFVKAQRFCCTYSKISQGRNV